MALVAAGRYLAPKLLARLGGKEALKNIAGS